jgi:hypothetical protein
MIDVSKVRYDLLALPPDGSQLHLTQLATKLTWEEQAGELAVRVQAAFQNQPIDGGRWLHEYLPNGTRLQLLADEGQGFGEVWRGSEFKWNNQDQGARPLTITAYDQLFYLMKSKDDRFYAAGTTARTILTDIAQDWGIPLGTVDGPDVALGKNLFRSKSLADMILDVLKQAKQRGAGKWILRSREGSIDIIRAGSNSTVYWLRADESVESAEEEESIEDLVTRVQIMGNANDDQRAPVIATVDGRTEFGILQELVQQAQNDTPDVAQTAARELMEERGQPKKTRRLSAPDVPTMRRGDRVRVMAGTMDGYYLVSSISRDMGAQTMSLEVEDE